jgi:hypothetical protein
LTTRIEIPADGQAKRIRVTAYRRLRHLGFRRTWWRGPIRNKRTGITLTVTRDVAHVDLPDEPAATEASRLAALMRLGGRTAPDTVHFVVAAVHRQEGRKTAGLPPR